MIKLVYYICVEAKEKELIWLREQSIYPASENAFDPSTGMPMIRIGVIVPKESALAIKLRHKIAYQAEYTQR